MRGRNNNNNNNNNSSNNNSNRRGPNPLTRSYESNGPDVKIRGSAQQIAEKYTTLARDAQTSGDRVMAENYLQHAEHYNRIIAAAQAQMAVQQARDTRDETDEDAEDDQHGDGQHGEGQHSDGQHSHGQHGEGQRSESATVNGSRAPRQHYANDGSGPQPVIEGTPAELAYNSHHNGAGQQPQPSAKATSNGQGEHADSEHAPEAVASEESPAPRRPRRPRRKPVGTQTAEADAAGAVEQPAESGTVEQAE
ncbi:MAG: DUF4167 domain-containing protein [Hyphomicrobiales bacterium]|nr:DUF4167 domain-containing protein [Hyphomicrobiales bacterium]